MPPTQVGGRLCLEFKSSGFRGVCRVLKFSDQILLDPILLCCHETSDARRPGKKLADNCPEALNT